MGILTKGFGTSGPHSVAPTWMGDRSLHADMLGVDTQKTYTPRLRHYLRPEVALLADYTD